MHFIFLIHFIIFLSFFSLSHRTCYLEGIVSLLLVWSVYSYVFFLSVLSVCCCSSPSSSKLQPKTPPPTILPIVYNFTLPTSHPSNLPDPPILSTLTAQPNNTDQNQNKNNKGKKRRKTTQPNPNTHTQKAPNSALEYPNYIQTAPNNYSPNSP